MTQQSKSRNRKRGCWLLLIIPVAILISIAAAATFWLSKNPVNNPTINRRVLLRLERMTGLDVAYDQASLSIAKGQYQIKNLRLSDPVNAGPPLLQIDEVYASVRPWELLLEPEARISSVILRRPTPLDFEYTANTLRLGHRTSILVNAIKAAQPPGTTTADLLPFDELDIRDVELTFTEAESIIPEDSPPAPTLRLMGDMHVENRAEERLAFDFDGAATGALASHEEEPSPSRAEDVKATLELVPGRQFTLSGSVGELALYDLFREHKGSSLLGRQLQFDLASSSTQQARSYAAKIDLQSLTMLDPQTDFVLNDENVAFNLLIDQHSTGSLTIHEGVLQSDGAALRVNGTADMQRPEPSYDLAIAGSALDAEYRAILQRALPNGWDVDPNTGNLAYDVDISIKDGALQHLNGLVQLRGINMRTPTLPASLRNLFGDLQFTPQGITFTDVTADYSGTRLALDGGFQGERWPEKIGHLSMNWTAIVDVENFMRLHGQWAAERSITASGRISGRGTWEQQMNFAALDQAGVPVIEGGFEFENIALEHPSLPGRVSELTGAAVVDDDQISLTNLTGKLHGNQMAVEGLVQGDQFFWRDPQVSATLTSRLDLANLPDYLTNQQEQALDAYALTGQAETRMQITGPFNDLGSHLTGAMRLESVGISPNLSFMEGRVEDISGSIRWNGSELTLQDLHGTINGDPVRLAGTIASNRLALEINSDGSLGTISRTFPQLTRLIDMDGNLTSDLQFTALAQNTQTTATTLANLLQQAHAVLAESVQNQSFTLQGHLDLNDVDLRIISMPPARRENGKNIPEGRVTGLTGRIQVRDTAFTIPTSDPLKCAFSDTPNCRLSGTVEFRPNNFPRMAIQISTHDTLKLDTWIAGWGRDLKRPDRPPITGKTFELDADIQAPRVELRGQSGGRSRGKLSFRMVQDESPRVTQFHEVVVQGYVPGTGRIIGNGRIESFYWNPAQFPRWSANVDVQAMPLETMLSAIFVQPSNIRGLTNGHLNIEGVGSNPLAIRGGGSAYVNNLELGRTAVIRQLGQTTGRDLGGRLFETAQAATFQIGNGALSSRDIVLQTNGLQLDMHGDYYFTDNPARGIPGKTIDGSLRLRLFKTVFGNLPIIGQVAELADEVTNAFLLAFRVTGPAANPRITPVPLPMFQGA